MGYLTDTEIAELLEIRDLVEKWRAADKELADYAAENDRFGMLPLDAQERFNRLKGKRDRLWRVIENLVKHL